MSKPKTPKAPKIGQLWLLYEWGCDYWGSSKELKSYARKVKRMKFSIPAKVGIAIYHRQLADELEASLPPAYWKLVDALRTSRPGLGGAAGN